MKRTAIISYLALPGIPIGFHQQGHCDIFTRDYAKIKPSDSEMLHKKNDLLKELHADVMKHIENYSTIYVYVGRFPPAGVNERTWHLFEMLQEYHYNRKENKVTIIGCGCSRDWKQHLIGYSFSCIKWEKVSCDPQEEVLAIIARENELAIAE